MGVKQSKRSVDITEISTKGEIEGFGNEGKVEKIIDGVVEKVAANGHVDGELQNGAEAHQNGLEPIQNGEAAAVATEKVTEKKDIDDSPVEGVINGQVENGEVHGEAEKTDETKKSEEKKDKRKDKKEKVVKKKFSFRNFSFSKKDKSKPPKEEKSPEKVDEAGAEETATSPEKEETTSPTEGQLNETPKPEEPTKQESDSSVAVVTNAVPEQVDQDEPAPAEVTPNTPATAEDLPPPLPASPPPSEPVEPIQPPAVSELKEVESSISGIMENSSGELNEVASSISNFSPLQMETPTEGMKDPEQIVFEAGKQIEEKATNLLKTVEERAEESLRTAGEMTAQKGTDAEAFPKESPVERADGGNHEAKEEMLEAANDAKTLEETVATIPIEISNLGSLSPKAEDASEKSEEGAGESLADMPKDLREEATAGAVESSNPDSLEIAAAAPPPDVDAVTGE